MAKRFITTDIFQDAWFMDLPAKYKLFWLFLITGCNHAGIWQVNFKLAEFYVGDHLEPAECERVLNGRIIKIDNGKYWFIPKFIEFQYGTLLKSSNKAVSKVIELLDQNNLLTYLPKVVIDKQQKQEPNKELPSTLIGAKEKEQVEVKDQFQLMEDEKERDRKLWNEIFPTKAGKAEILFVEEWVKKFGEERTEKILIMLKENGFHKIATMRKAIDENGNLRPRSETNLPDIMTYDDMLEFIKNKSVNESKRIQEHYNYDRNRQYFVLKEIES